MAGQRNRLLPLILIAVAGWYAYQYFSKPKQPEQAGPATTGMERQSPPTERIEPRVSRTETPARQAEAPASRREMPPREAPAAASRPEAGVGNPLTVDNIDLGHEVDALLDTAVKVLAGISDEASAREAVARLGEINQALDIVGKLAQKLSAGGRRMLGEVIAKSAQELDQAIAAAYRAPGVSEVIGNEVNTLVQKFSTLAKG